MKHREFSAHEQVPSSERHHSFIDMVVLWAAANASTSTWYMGGIIAGLGLINAVAISLTAGIFSFVVFSLISYMGYRVGTTSMGLARASFGIRGSIMPSILNITMFIGWCAINTFISAVSLSFLAKKTFGIPAYGEAEGYKTMSIAIILIVIIQTSFISLGGGRTLKKIERGTTVLLIVLTLLVLYSIISMGEFSHVVEWKPMKFFISQGQALDIAAALVLSWVTASADFSRYSRSFLSSTIAPAIGGITALVWLIFIGAASSIAVAVSSGVYSPASSDPSTVLSKLGFGWAGFLILITATVSANMMNIYSAGMSISNISVKIKPEHGLVSVAAGSTVLAFVFLFAVSFIDAFRIFLEYIGFILAPVLGIMVADFFAIKKRNYYWNDPESEKSLYWYTGGVNKIAFLCWICGGFFYLVIHRIPVILNNTGSIIITVLFSFILYVLAAKKM